MLKASEKFMCIIIRRPHAYELREQVFKKQNVPIPGIIFLDGEGKFVGSSRLETAKELVEKMEELAKKQ